MTDEHGKMMKTTLSSRLKPPLGHLRRFSQLWLLLGCAVLLSMLVLPSRALLHIGIPRRGRTRPPSVLFDSEADYADTVVGWERYSMVPLPDSMLSTTLFVGNLCEFVHDGDLSHLFQSVSVLHSLPACVARKPNAQSLQYGFVAFPTVAEKEAAIVRFDGYQWRGRPLKVQSILDHPTRGRVRVPEKLVAYVSGAEKKTRSGQTNELRKSSRDLKPLQPAGRPKRKASTAAPPASLNDNQSLEMDRAARKGFLTLIKGGKRVGKGGSLKEIHRKWCEDRDKPQVILYKSHGGHTDADRVLIDFSPMLCCDESQNNVESLVEAAFAEAAKCDMKPPQGREPESAIDVLVTSKTNRLQPHRADGRLKKHVIFDGSRANAKALTKSLALLWDIPDKDVQDEEGQAVTRPKRGNKQYLNAARQNRKRGGGRRQAYIY